MIVEAYLKNERGLALVVALMLLVLLTVMGLAAISTTTTEMQITSNERTDSQAFHAAEAGIKEVLYRSTLPSLGTNSIANGGSYVTVDGFPFDAAIRDPALTACGAANPSGNPDPCWQYNIYFGAPLAGANNVRSILSASDQAKLNYGKTDQGVQVPVTVRYVTERDLKNWGLAVYDLNGDGDVGVDGDLVYFNGDANAPARLGAVGPAGVAVNGTADTAPPIGTNSNLVVRLITAVGHSGKATKQIQLETTGFPVNPNANAAVQANIQVNFGGAGFISGYNHSEDTTPADAGSINNNLYNNNGCDNYSGGAGSGGCGMGTDPESNCPANKPCNAEYSGKASATGSKPAIVTNSAVTTTGNAVEAWGGNDDNTDGWKKVDPNLGFPSLAQLLGVDQQIVDQMLDSANTNPNACPSGVTYIDNKNSGQVYMPNQIPNCPKASGVLVVTGDMKITSQFEFRGLVYVQGDAELRGGAWLLGSMAIQGAATGLTAANGTPTILYSRNTVVNAVTAAMNQAGFAFTTLSWREQ